MIDRSNESFSATSVYARHVANRCNTTSTITTKPREKLFDVDCNLYHPALFENAFEYMKEASDEGVMGWVVPGSDLNSSFTSLSLQNQAKDCGLNLFSTIGVHPYMAASQEQSMVVEDAMEVIQKNAFQFAAIGECGLDYSDGFPDREVQMRWFIPQFDLACRMGIPVFLHERLAFDDIFDILKAAKNCGKLPSILVHCFTGSTTELKAYLDIGCYVSFSGLICRAQAGSGLRKSIREAGVPLDKIMIETDAPYLGFPGCRIGDRVTESNGKSTAKSIFPNVPRSLPMVLSALSEVLHMDEREVAKLTRQNAMHFFSHTQVPDDS